MDEDVAETVTELALREAAEVQKLVRLYAAVEFLGSAHRLHPGLEFRWLYHSFYLFEYLQDPRALGGQSPRVVVVECSLERKEKQCSGDLF